MGTTARGAFSNIATPFLSLADPGYSKEGGLDPLGLYAIGDSLGVRLVPGVRERMSDPRYLTIMAVGMAVCGGMDREVVAADGKSGPWQVFEWYVVEGLVRMYGNRDDVRGLPGVEKVRTALRNESPIGAANYLKTPHVFGFHGIYRGLGEALELFDDAGLLPLGWELVEAWETDQGLPGFHGPEGDSAGRRQQLVSAIKAGLDRGATARSPGWAGWEFIGDHLAPGVSGAGELAVLQKALRGPQGGHRQQVLDFLISEAGQQVWDTGNGDERAFHEGLRGGSDASVRRLLDAISAYEWFARLLQDAFDDCLYWLNSGYGRLAPSGLADAPAVQRAAAKVPAAYERAAERLDQFNQSGRFTQAFSGVADAGNSADWVAGLLDHHYRTQTRKPPDGKNPWFDRFDDGSVAVRAAYGRDKGGRGDDQYVHYYRTWPLASFAGRLGMLPS